MIFTQKFMHENVIEVDQEVDSILKSLDDEADFSEGELSDEELGIQ